MKRIALTQRVELKPSYSERRDVLDQRWIEFLLSIKLWPILVPNNLHYVRKLFGDGGIDGVLLTGGNSLVHYGGEASERDEVEKFILEWALERNTPLLGVCRGMQVIQDYFGNKLIKISGHVATRHTLFVEDNRRLSLVVQQYSDVNSYHNMGTKYVEGDLLKVAASFDGVVMAVEHREKEIFGVMWHSERESPFRVEDTLLFDYIFKGER